jgi:small subunit ribosomal protein S15
MSEETYSDEEIKTLVVKLRDEGHQPSMIGMRLRDNYGIPAVKEATGMSITEILEDEGEGLDLPEDLRNLVLKAARLREHLDENEKDATAIQGLQRTEDKIRALADYYRESGSLSADWTYDPEDINILLD